MRFKLPALRYWFARKASVPMATSAFSAWLGLTQMRLLIDDLDFWIIFGLGLGLGLLGWWSIAADSQRAERLAEKAAEDAQEQLEGMRRLLARWVPEDEIPVRFDNLSRLTNQELREKIACHVAAIRQFAIDIEEGRFTDPYWVRNPELRNLDEAESTRLFLQDANDQIETSRRRVERYNLEIRPDSLALLQELDRRILRRRSDREMSHTIEHGSLAGGSPIQDSAIFLETIVRRLP